MGSDRDDMQEFVTLLEKLIDQRINAARPQHDKRPHDDIDYCRRIVDLLARPPEKRSP